MVNEIGGNEHRKMEGKFKIKTKDMYNKIYRNKEFRDMDNRKDNGCCESS